MATAYKDLYPDPTADAGLSSYLMSDAILIGTRRQQRFTHTVGLPGNLQIETDEPELRPEVVAIVESLRHIKSLREGWDTYTARPVNRQAFRPALDLALYAVQRCQQPRLTASSDGGIVLVWDDGDRELELEVAPAHGQILAFMVDAEGMEHEPEAAISLEEAKVFIDAFCRA